ncbi:MAG: histidinol dehydrogenase [SAR202 cluster bacterium]|nr:histidinol dehydrogenase [SAR202 cluster bacterium]
MQAVQAIIDRVRKDGDAALRDLSIKFDGAALDAIEVPRSAIDRAYDEVPGELVDALDLSASRVRMFHEASMPKGWTDFKQGYGEVFNPVESVGAYIPGGSAPLMSTVLMSAIPARVAGVREVFVATPAGKGKPVHPAVLVAADIARVDRVFQVGGAQAIAALAYGTESIPKVDMVCGPGNIFVTIAKKLVYGDVGIDGLYGPTETVVIGDETANITFCAADLIAQAEHDVMARPVFITTSLEVAEAVSREIDIRLARLDRADTIRASVDHQGVIAVVETLEHAFDLANAFAPEHMCLAIRDPWTHVGRVKHAGAIFLGEFSHEVLGDYVAGPSHVMPTAGTARFGSGLNVRSFLKVSPVIGLDEATAMVVARAASVIGRAEGLTAHAEAAEIREEFGKG